MEPKIEFENIWDYNEKFRLNLDHPVMNIVVGVIFCTLGKYIHVLLKTYFTVHIYT